MSAQTFILNTPTLAISKIDNVPITVPQNATVKVERGGQPLDAAPTLIEVEWEGRSLLMFQVDLRQRATPVGREPSP